MASLNNVFVVGEDSYNFDHEEVKIVGVYDSLKEAYIDYKRRKEEDFESYDPGFACGSHSFLIRMTAAGPKLLLGAKTWSD